MPITIHTNSTATAASFNLSKSNELLKKSLQRLSSGERIVSPADDAGGLAVAMKLKSVLRRTEATRNNIQNGVSFLQVQDGAYKVLGQILDRMSELKSFFNDISKNTQDRTNYNYEFTELQQQIVNLKSEKFNGVSLFSTTPASAANPTFTIITTEDGISGVVSITRNAIFDNFFTSQFGADGTNGANTVTRNTSLGSTSAGAITDSGDTDNEKNLIDSSTSLGDFSVADFIDYIQSLANARAVNGGEMSRLNFSHEMLVQNQINLEAARGRIMDADMALESSRFAKYNVLTQAGAAMVSQANSLSNITLQLLQ